MSDSWININSNLKSIIKQVKLFCQSAANSYHNKIFEITFVHTFSSSYIVYTFSCLYIVLLLVVISEPWQTENDELYWETWGNHSQDWRQVHWLSPRDWLLGLPGECIVQETSECLLYVHSNIVYYMMNQVRNFGCQANITGDWCWSHQQFFSPQSNLWFAKIVFITVTELEFKDLSTRLEQISRSYRMEIYLENNHKEQEQTISIWTKDRKSEHL